MSREHIFRLLHWHSHPKLIINSTKSCWQLYLVHVEDIIPMYPKLEFRCQSFNMRTDHRAQKSKIHSITIACISTCLLHAYFMCTGHVSPLESSASPAVLPTSPPLSQTSPNLTCLPGVPDRKNLKCQIEEEIRSANACRQVCQQAFCPQWTRRASGCHLLSS